MLLDLINVEIYQMQFLVVKWLGYTHVDRVLNWKKTPKHKSCRY